MKIIVTGSTRGIGEGIAGVLARNGAGLVLGYLEDENHARKLVDSLSGTDSEIHLFKGDTTTVDGCRLITEFAREKLGRVDALVSNLGPFLYRSVEETSINDWHRMVQSNLNAHFYLVKGLLAEMIKRKSGNFVFIGGVGSSTVTGHPMAAAYNAAKTGLTEFVKTLAFEQGPNGIRANMVTPGIIDNGEYSPGFMERMPSKIPLGRIGNPTDIGHAVAFLLSPDADYITGAVLDVSGGFHISPG